jgi:hypothetical protein
MGFLAAAALGAVGYGLFGAIGFVGNWDWFKSGIQQLLQ